MRIRVCHMCKEYVLIFPENPFSERVVKAFEFLHNGHTIVTMDIKEIDSSYTNLTKKLKKSS